MQAVGNIDEYPRNGQYQHATTDDGVAEFQRFEVSFEGVYFHPKSIDSLVFALLKCWGRLHFLRNEDGEANIFLGADRSSPALRRGERLWRGNKSSSKTASLRYFFMALSTACLLGAGGRGWGGYLSPFMVLLHSCVGIVVFWGRG